MNPKLTHRYVEDGMATISRPQLVLRLYERLQLDLKRATAAVDQNNIEETHHALVHGQDVVHELNLALDIDQWEQARTLRSIYQYMTELLIEANITKNPDVIDQVAELVDPLCDAWREALHQPVAAPAASRGPGQDVAPAAAPASADAFADTAGRPPNRTQVVA